MEKVIMNNMDITDYKVDPYDYKPPVNRFCVRVWDRENSSMIYSVRKINSIYALATTEKHNGNNLKYVIMQSAGVQDSNRKMIYEGDILRAKNSTLKDLVVCYNISEGLLNMYSLQDNGWHKIDYKVCYKYTEIVGNIYEHREEWGKIIFNKLLIYPFNIHRSTRQIK